MFRRLGRDRVLQQPRFDQSNVVDKKNEKHGKAADTLHRSYSFMAGMPYLECIFDPIRNRLHRAVSLDGHFVLFLPGVGFMMMHIVKVKTKIPAASAREDRHSRTTRPWLLC